MKSLKLILEALVWSRCTAVILKVLKVPPCENRLIRSGMVC
jgi:hypothetical protein